MSYTHHLQLRLEQLLAGMPEGERAIIIREVKAIALESYRSGEKAAAVAHKRNPSPKASRRITG